MYYSIAFPLFLCVCVYPRDIKIAMGCECLSIRLTKQPI